MPAEPDSICLRCDGAAGYNRVVYDLVANRVAGSLCRNCELDHLSPMLESDQRRSVSTCHYRNCARDAFVSFPRWQPESTVSNGYVESTVAYDPADPSVLLCDEHLDCFVSSDSTTNLTERAASEFR